MSEEIKQPDEDAKERVLIAAINLRRADRVSIASKLPEDQRFTYKQLNNLRAAVDELDPQP